MRQHHPQQSQQRSHGRIALQQPAVGQSDRQPKLGGNLPDGLAVGPEIAGQQRHLLGLQAILKQPSLEPTERNPDLSHSIWRGHHVNHATAVDCVGPIGKESPFEMKESRYVRTRRLRQGLGRNAQRRLEPVAGVVKPPVHEALFRSVDLAGQRHDHRSHALCHHLQQGQLRGRQTIETVNHKQGPAVP